MENVFDIKYKQQLEYILPDTVASDMDLQSMAFRNDTVVIMYFYYIDTLADYWKYIDNIQKFVKVFVITPLEEIEKKISDKATTRRWVNVEIIRKPNRGRDITGLLIAAKPVISRYKYICFIHDKKSHFKETEKDVALWIENMWENLIGNAGHIQKILGVSLGVKDIENDKPNNNNVWFTMQGVRIEGQPVVPGIYIRNGKAVVRK